jgi:hypothetical protein
MGNHRVLAGALSHTTDRNARHLLFGSAKRKLYCGHDIHLRIRRYCVDALGEKRVILRSSTELEQGGTGLSHSLDVIGERSDIIHRCDAAHRARLVEVETTAAVQRGAIVPDNEIADLPLMLVNELALSRMFQKFEQQLAALRNGHSKDLPQMAAYEQNLSA